MSDCEHGQPAWAACPKCIDDAADRMGEQINEQKKRIAELEAIIEAAPHRADCRKLDPYYKASSNSCNCWKSKAEEQHTSYAETHTNYAKSKAGEVS